MFPDMNDPDLTELLKRFALSAADQDAARKRAIATFGLGLLGARKGREGEAIGRAGLLGMQAKDQALADAQQGKLRDFQIMQYAAKAKEQKAAKKEQAEIKLGAAQAMGGSPLSAMGPGGPTQANLGAVQEAQGPMGEAKKFRALSAFYGAKGLVDQAKKASEIAETIEKRLEDEYGVSPTTGIGPDGKPVFVRWSKKGKKQIESGVVPPPDLQILNLGGQHTAIDKLRTAPGTSFNVTMDPAQIAANKIAQGQLGVAQGQLGVSQANLAQRKAEHDAKLAADKAAGTASDKATDPQLAARGFLHRMRGAEEIVSGIEAGGYTPSFGTAYVEGMKGVPIIGGTAGGFASMARNAVSPEAGNYAQAQDDWIRAKLRKESGAVISPEEMEGERRTYFPQPGDSDALIKQKRLARKRAEEQMAIQAKESLVLRSGASGGWSITPVN